MPTCQSKTQSAAWTFLCPNPCSQWLAFSIILCFCGDHHKVHSQLMLLPAPLSFVYTDTLILKVTKFSCVLPILKEMSQFFLTISVTSISPYSPNHMPSFFHQDKIGPTCLFTYNESKCMSIKVSDPCTLRLIFRRCNAMSSSSMRRAPSFPSSDWEPTVIVGHMNCGSTQAALAVREGGNNGDGDNMCNGNMAVAAAACLFVA